MDKQYNPHEIEGRIYKKWLDGKYFHAEIDKDKAPFTISIAPPNITSRLHIGHAFENTLSDIIIRFKRMQGYAAMWLPGTDHASIATEVKIVEAMADEGITKEGIGREAFLKRGWEWYNTYGSAIVEQLQRMGFSCDWDRLRFTMDDGLNRAVNEFFIRLYEKGYIYRGEKLCNWCSTCETTISDAEVMHNEQETLLYHIKYPIKELPGEFIQFATTRPETILADTAVAVNPDDPRFAALIGMYVTVPFVNREIPIIADDYVSMEFGTGVVKITPGHDHNDFEVGTRHNLPQINILNDDGTLNQICGVYEGKTVKAARELVLSDLETSGLFVKAEKIQNSIGTHDRCKDIVEPRLKTQWFVAMKKLAEPALDAYKTGKLRIIPERFGKVYSHWLEGIHDWCISRQLWWGHRIPAWFCACGEISVARDLTAENAKCAKCGSTNLKQEEDVLDTWFSSALWPFSTLGWPDKTPELEYFYPTQTMNMGRDILFFWGVRMMFSAIEMTGELPFKDLIFHGLVRDKDGNKMSKSAGNGIDPLEMLEQYGTDALRLALITGNAPGEDFRFRDEKITSCRNFTNKLWNAARFLQSKASTATDNTDSTDLTDTDKWLISSCNNLIKDVTKLLEEYDLGLAAAKVFDFIWDEFCDWGIEMAKPRFAENNNAAAVLTSVFLDLLRLLHPFMPFITEEIFGYLQNSEKTIMLSNWPVYKAENSHADAEREIINLKDTVTAIRSARAEKNVPPSRKVGLYIVGDNDGVRGLYERNSGWLASMAGASDVVVTGNKSGVPDNSLSLIVPGAVVYIPISDLVDTEQEITRLEKEKARLAGEVARCESKLANKGFTDKARPELVAAEQTKLTEYKDMLSKVAEELAGYVN
ncbi:MAG: valine--tRNA ligase [Defluviitaleaceae bacterium]|nr:valine--tRNA ligase [Defluviitaleaceae bacterium]